MRTFDFDNVEARWWCHYSSRKLTEPPACSPRRGSAAEEKRSGTCGLNVIDERYVVVVIRVEILAENVERLPVATDLVFTKPLQLLDVQQILIVITHQKEVSAVLGHVNV